MHSYYPEHFKKDIIKISDEVCKTFPDVDYIFGIARGGLVAATALSYRLNVPLEILDPQKNLFIYDSIYRNLIHSLKYGKKILVVDDMIDSGKMIREVLDHCEEWKRENWNYAGTLKTAVLIYNTAQEIVPDFFGRTIDRKKNLDYINFFWERVELCQ